jgi:hypothetical protein
VSPRVTGANTVDQFVHRWRAEIWPRSPVTEKSAVMDEEDYVLLVQEDKVRPSQLGT